MYVTIQRFGNNSGLPIPQFLLDALGIRENDRVELIPSADSITIKKAPVPQHKTLEERLTAFYGKPVDQIQPIQTVELDWGQPEGDEAW